jgi:hypothetical protein
MRILDWDRIPDRKITGPIVVPIEDVLTDEARIEPRTVRYYVKTDTQRWYFEPITTARVDGRFYANGLYSDSKVEACRQLGFKDLQIIYVDVSR